MKKIFSFLKVFIPAYIIAMLMYSFSYLPDKGNYASGSFNIVAAFSKIEKELSSLNLINQKSKTQNVGITQPVEGKLTITLLDINHGDAILLQDSKQTVMVDVGDYKNKELLIKKLAAHNVKRVNTVIITHHDADHVGNILTVAGKYGVSRIYDNGLVNPNNAVSVKLNDILSKGNYHNKRLRAGDKVSFGDGFYMEVLSPGDFLDSSLRQNPNNNSIVMKLHYGSFTMMFTGDIENPTEVALAAKYGANLKADILKVAHHGSRTSSNYQFISKVKPKYALISCGPFEKYHHPNKNVVGSLKHLGAEVYSTNANGDLTVTTDGKNFSVTTEK